MNVKLLHITPIEIAVLAIRQCYESMDKSDSVWTNENSNTHEYEYILGDKDKALIERVIESGHTSTLEHINVTFKLENFTRDVLQELSRHRHASPSVKSTRYTLKELKSEDSFLIVKEDEDRGIFVEHNIEAASKYVELTGNDILDTAIIGCLEAIRISLAEGMTNDQVKPALPEAYLVSSIFTINMRSLRNLLELRTSHRAYHKIRSLAYAMYNALPDSYKFMVDDCIAGEKV